MLQERTLYARGEEVRAFGELDVEQVGDDEDGQTSQLILNIITEWQRDVDLQFDTLH